MGGVESTEGGIKGVYGLQVGSLLPRSPACKAGLLPFFDFIVKVDTYELSEDTVGFFREYLKKHLGEAVKLTVYNSKVLCLRELTLVPSDTWGGSGLLGCSLEWSNTIMSWHVTGVSPESPLRSCIRADKDFIIGFEVVGGDPKHPIITLFCDKDDFHARLVEKMQLRIEKRCSDRLLMLVYDGEENTIREVYADLVRAPSLGIDVGNGYLHNIPPGKELPVMKGFIEFNDGHGAETFATASEMTGNAGQQRILPTVEQETDKEEQQRLALLFQAQQDHEKRKEEERRKEELRLEQEKKNEIEKQARETKEKEAEAALRAEEEANIQQHELHRQEEAKKVAMQLEQQQQEQRLKVAEEQRELQELKAAQEEDKAKIAMQQEELLAMRNEQENQLKALRDQQESLRAQHEEQVAMKKQMQLQKIEQEEESRRIRQEREALDAAKQGKQLDRRDSERFNQGATPKPDFKPPSASTVLGSLDQLPNTVQPVKRYAPQLDAVAQPTYPHSPIHAKMAVPVQQLNQPHEAEHGLSSQMTPQQTPQPQAGPATLPASALPADTLPRPSQRPKPELQGFTTQFDSFSGNTGNVSTPSADGDPARQFNRRESDFGLPNDPGMTYPFYAA